MCEIYICKKNLFRICKDHIQVHIVFFKVLFRKCFMQTVSPIRKVIVLFLTKHELPGNKRGILVYHTIRVREK